MAPAVVKVNKRITDKIRELNGTGFFQKEIRLGAVARKLTEMDVEKALELLQSVAEDAGNYEDPTAKVLEAIQKLNEEAKEEEVEEEVPEPLNEPQEEQQEEQADWAEWPAKETEAEGDETANLSATVKGRVLKLNKSGKLCSDIDLSKVGSGLARLSEPIALQLLKDVDENADMVDKPTHLIGDACKKIHQSGRGSADEKVARQIGNLMRRIRWVNSNVTLAYPLHMGNVLDILQPLEHTDAMQVLKKLVEQAEEIESPQTWLRKEARQYVDDGGKWGGQSGWKKWDQGKDKWDKSEKSGKPWNSNSWDKGNGQQAPVTAYTKPSPKAAGIPAGKRQRTDGWGKSQWKAEEETWEDLGE
ncbi:unnamed protein product [Durusdinium trenchii]|uniref:Uncharacterized protein n=2 Tax=Durusdinium trenchii TaxID=1381693 RepID=A0ABP0I3Z8_9DINO